MSTMDLNMEERSFCPACGAAVVDGGVFCARCGARISGMAEAEAAPTNNWFAQASNLDGSQNNAGNGTKSSDATPKTAATASDRSASSDSTFIKPVKGPGTASSGGRYSGQAAAPPPTERVGNGAPAARSESRCKKCGTVVPKGTTLCWKCASASTESNTQASSAASGMAGAAGAAGSAKARTAMGSAEKASAPRGFFSMHKKLVFIAAAVCVVLIGCLVLFFSGVVQTNPVDKFSKQVQNNQYSDALETYFASIAGDSAKEVATSDFLKQHLEDAWRGYLDETISKSDFEGVLKTVQRIDEKIGLLGRTLTEIAANYPEVATSKAAYQNGVDEFENGNYEAAMAAFSHVQAADEKNYNKAQDQYLQAKNLYIDSILASANEKLIGGNYDGALDILMTAERTVGTESRFNDMRSRIVTADFESKMRSAADAGDFTYMSAVYNDALENDACRVSAEMTGLYSDQQRKFRQDIIDRSITAYKSEGYEAAIPIISEGLTVLPQDENLLKYDKLYKSCVPVDLTNITELSRSSSYPSMSSTSNISDIYGNEYTGAIYYNEIHNLTIEYYLNGLYSEFSFSCFADAKMGESKTVKFSVTADDIEIFTTDYMNRRSDIISTTLNVSNVRVLSINWHSPDEEYFDWFGPYYLGSSHLYLINPTLMRSLTDSDLRS